MWPWIAIVVLLLLAPRLLRVWGRRRARVEMLSQPLFRGEYAEAAPDGVPDGLRDGLTAASVELMALGFELLGFIQSERRTCALPRIQAVLRHPVELTFAVVSFAIADRLGVAVDFETLFTDGWWLRTGNRRAHWVLAPVETGRIGDPYVATLAEQWRYHQDAVTSESARTRRDVGLDDLVRHRNAVDHDEYTVGARLGFYRFDDDGERIRITPKGADSLIQRITDAATRAAAAPPLAGVLAMPCPADDLERKYQNVVIANAQKPKSRARWAFPLSVIAFAASALLFKHWAWLLSLIPFLLLHELGHWSAMRLFGHRDARIRFVPFLGAATLTTKQFRTLSQEMIVLLAGPVPGIVLGLALFQFIDFGRDPYALFSAITLVTINGINLLPLHPLDGGRIVHALVTAGRPRLDIALKVIAGALFVAGAIVMKDVTLALVAGIAFLFVRPGLRLARLDNGIRRRPGFGPTLTPEERRRFIFEALPDPRVNEGPGWVTLVQQLEVSLGHGQSRLWPALPWGIVYVACLGGLLAWGTTVSAVARTVNGACPPRTRASTLACSAPQGTEDIDWDKRDPDSVTRNPFKLTSYTQYPHAAFVWCTGEPAAIFGVTERLWEATAAAGLCPALPWEFLPPEKRAERDSARWTMKAITVAGPGLPREERIAYIDRVKSRAIHSPKYDPETVRLYRASLEGEAADDTRRRLADRIGPSVSESCTRLRIGSVHIESDDADDAEAGPVSGADRGGPSTTAGDEILTARLTVMLASPGDFAPLRRYLCAAGCQVAVLPYGSLDSRLFACF